MVTVLAVTVLWKATPPDWVMMMVPMSVPTAPVTVTAPVVLRVRLLTAPAAVPVIDPRLMVFAIPVPIVRANPSAKVAVPKVMAPVEVPPTAVFPPTVTGGRAQINKSRACGGDGPVDCFARRRSGSHASGKGKGVPSVTQG